MEKGIRSDQKIWRVRPEWPFLLFLVFVIAAYIGLLLLMVGANVLTVSWSQASEILKDADSGCDYPYYSVSRNKKHWMRMKDILEKRGAKEKVQTMEIFDDKILEQEVLSTTNI